MPEQLTHQLELIEPTDLRLNEVAREISVDEISSQYVQGVIDRMLELSAGKGHSKHDSRQMVGLAAVQLGVGMRLITIDTTADGSLKEQNLQVLINPTISDKSNEMIDGREGCWSCGNICGNVQRSKQVTVKALDRVATPVTLELADFVARIAQHEIDHLDGIRFPDRIPNDEPWRLHRVESAEFAQYRTEWQHWTHLTPRGVWESMKLGRKS